MKYSDHKIKPTGHIELREVIEETDAEGEVIDKTFHRSVISPNEPIPAEYQAEIESDENFAKYRTQENADAYEAKMAELEPTAEELSEQEAKRQLQEQRNQVKQELKASLPPQSNPELSKRIEKLEFILGIRDSYTSE